MAQGREDNQAQPDELGKDPGQVGPQSAGHSGESQPQVSDASEASVEELAGYNQALEAEGVEGSEDAAKHPERPVRTHNQYGRPGTGPPGDNSGNEAA